MRVPLSLPMPDNVKRTESGWGLFCHRQSLYPNQMTGRTHDLGAFSALVIAMVFLPQLPTMSLVTAFVAFGANFMGGLFPDLDQTTSDFWDNFRFGPVVAKIICTFLGGHRNISHSLLGFAIIGVGSRFLLQLVFSFILVDINVNIVWWSFMLGVISHYVLDMVTREGLPLLWPLNHKFGIPPIKRLRMPAGGPLEHFIVFPALLVMDAYLMYMNQEKILYFLHQYIH